jgi:hypothetical protein
MNKQPKPLHYADPSLNKPSRIVAILWLVLGIPAFIVVAWFFWCFFAIGVADGFELDRPPTQFESLASWCGAGPTQIQ